MPYHTHVQRGQHIAHITAEDDTGRDGPFEIHVVAHGPAGPTPTGHHATAKTAHEARETAIKLLQKATGEDAGDDDEHDGDRDRDQADAGGRTPTRTRSTAH